MQVEEIINILKQNYEPDEYLIVTWWDHWAFEEYVDKEIWEKHAYKYEKHMDNSIFHEDIKEFLLDPAFR